MREEVEDLRRFRPFADLSPDDVEEFMNVVDEVRLSDGEELFQEGDVGTSAYLVVAGSVEVRFRTKRGQQRADVTLRPGAVFGELALLTDAPRNATIVADGDVELWEVGRDAFGTGISRRDRWAIAFLLASARELAARFSNLNRELLALIAEVDDRKEAGRPELAELGRLRMRLLTDWSF